ncbi:DEAD/DEAH box helicase family protein [Salegentibacter salarius]|uniref:Helicase ATP-binding domain-containing protein n=1 Tax=Salegentibacter salarius TaxID=435906 RepID=A0A2N0TRE5_9FLAO|nr:DEAD/DEAH box helicase family protein [Salegentibacter salarius]OEY71961.1 hypothetical protein BHS39_14685 [Salegentibacter salarius]PKD17317.1 hypothetical protein APR40_14655 [Salegentibacter salarius]SLK05577.1 Superfamily II DNA or RNA helicase [Salegentibacter salarius]
MPPNKIPQSKELRIDKYISEKSKEINSFIQENRRILLNASPGSGKTTFFANLCISHLQNKNPGRIIFCSPFLIIQSQFKRAIEKKSLEIDLVLNHTTSRNYLQNSDKIITSTFKSLSRIKTELSENDLIIVDEAHSLLFTYGNSSKREFFTGIINILYHTPAKIVLMTGTPYSGITKILNLSQLKILKEDIKAKVNIQYTNEKDTALSVAFAEYCLNQFGKDYLNIIYIKNTKKCEIIKQVLERKFDCKAFVLTARRKESKVYKLLELESLIPEDINFLITTNVISTGTNILNKNIGKALMLNESNPTEIKQFSKRFRNKMNIEIDVINKAYSKNDLDTKSVREDLELEREHQRQFFTTSLATIEHSFNISQEFIQFDKYYHKDVYNGSPQHLINTILERMLIQEAYYAEKIAETYNTPAELMNVLNSYDDVISINTDEYGFTISSEDLGEAEINKLDELKFQLIVSDFIRNQESYLKSAYWYFMLKRDNYRKYLISNYLNPDFPTRLIGKEDIDENKFEIYANSNFIPQILLPLFEIDEFFKDRSKSLYFIKTVKPNKRKATLIALYLNNLFKQYLKFNFDEYPKFPPVLELRPEINYHLLIENERIHSILKICKYVYEYLTHQHYINYGDLNEYLVANCTWKFPLIKDDFIFKEIDIDINSQKPLNFRQNLLIGMANSIFYINPKQVYRKDQKTNKRKAAYLFESTLPSESIAKYKLHKTEIKEINENTEILNYSMRTRKFGKVNFKKSSRILNSRKLILNTIVDDNFYELVSGKL